ncbi:MAG: hypothetical protein WC355_02010 [Candidatus Omnitrophota bacterium]|jgi:uncharacterized protein (UPF0333 family)
MFRGKRGQSTLEYVILIGFVVAALIAMGVYMKRGMQGRLRESTDQIGEQYSAGNTEAEYTVTTGLTQTESMVSGGGTTTEIERNVQRKSGYEKVSGFSSED